MGIEIGNETETHDGEFVLLFSAYALSRLASAMAKPMMMMSNAGTGSPAGQGRSMGTTRMNLSEFQRTGRSAKILEFSPAGSAKHIHSRQESRQHSGQDLRQSWSRQAGVSDAERLLALTVGALITPAVWAGHWLLVWMHLL